MAAQLVRAEIRDIGLLTGISKRPVDVALVRPVEHGPRALLGRYGCQLIVQWVRDMGGTEFAVFGTAQA